MKKILSIILACMLAISMVTFVSADDGKKVVDFIYGTPTIDGQIEALWDFAPKATANELSAGSTLTDSYGTVRGMWDNTNNLYILVEVYDTTPYYLVDTHKCDNVELSFDPYINEAVSYDDDPTAGKLNIGAHPDSPVGISKGTWDASWYEKAVSYTDTGWIMEVRVDLGSYDGIKFAEDMDLGFDFMIGDYPSGEGTSRTCGIGWNDLTDSAWQYPFVLGLIHLIKVDTSAAVEETVAETEAAVEETEAVVEETVAETEAAVEETEAVVEETVAETEAVVETVETVEVTEAPQTFDVAIIAGVAAVISLAGYEISKKH